MIDELAPVLTIVSAVGAALVGGMFFAFSTFIMKALGRLPAAHGIAAMQSINAVVINPLFLAAFFGTAVSCIALAVFSLVRWHPPGTALLLAGSALYLLGTILVTLLCNVPRNGALAAVEPASDEGARLWARYLRTWTAWNHVRTVAAISAAASLMLALRY